MRQHSVGLAAALIVGLIGASTAAAQAPPPAVLEVTGHGAVGAEPDTALLTLAVDTSHRRAAEAVVENARLSEALLKALRGLMGPEDQVGTSGFSVSPIYDDQQRLAPSGYRVSNQVLLETRRVKQVGDFIDAAAGLGAGRIGGLQFKASNEEALADEAAALAVRQARRTAEVLARAGEVSIRRVREIRSLSRAPAPRFRAEAAVLRSATPIEPGELTIEAEVTVVFELE
jgi:uncharacterized protein YggE